LSLYEFISYIHRMIDDGQDFGEENTVSPDDHTLRVMTIHASKGLEFNYVIYAGLHRRLNMMDISKKVSVQPEEGSPVKRFGPEALAVMPGIRAAVAARGIVSVLMSEEMWLADVAVTRAIDKLVMPLVYNDEYKED